MKKIFCSVPILTLNSEKYLEKCLESLVDFEDVYLVDGNSTDRTLEIAKKYNVPVYKQVETEEKNVRITDFSKIRRRAYGFAKTNWLLDLDSDEYLSGELVDEIREVLKNKQNSNIAYRIPSKIIYNEKEVHYAFQYPQYYARLYHRESGIDFPEGKKVLHEVVTVPDSIEQKDLKNHVFSHITSSYRESIEKDNWYLQIVKEKFFPQTKDKKNKKMKYAFIFFKSSIINFLRAINIGLKSLFFYIRYGYKASLPFSQVWRHIRYHLIISTRRLRQTYYEFFKY